MPDVPHTKVRSRSQETPELAGSGTGQERCVSKAAFGQAGDTMMSVGSGLRGRVRGQGHRDTRRLRPLSAASFTLHDRARVDQSTSL